MGLSPDKQNGGGKIYSSSESNFIESLHVLVIDFIQHGPCICEVTRRFLKSLWPTPSWQSFFCWLLTNLKMGKLKETTWRTRLSILSTNHIRSPEGPTLYLLHKDCRKQDGDLTSVGGARCVLLSLNKTWKDVNYCFQEQHQGCGREHTGAKIDKSISGNQKLHCPFCCSSAYILRILVDQGSTAQGPLIDKGW